MFSRDVELSDGSVWRYSRWTKKWTRLFMVRGGQRFPDRHEISTVEPWLKGLKALTPKDHQVIAAVIEKK